jgi:hypothetical protein
MRITATIGLTKWPVMILTWLSTSESEIRQQSNQQQAQYLSRRCASAERSFSFHNLLQAVAMHGAFQVGKMDSLILYTFL